MFLTQVTLKADPGVMIQILVRPTSNATPVVLDAVAVVFQLRAFQTVTRWATLSLFRTQGSKAAPMMMLRADASFSTFPLVFLIIMATTALTTSSILACWILKREPLLRKDMLHPDDEEKSIVLYYLSVLTKPYISLSLILRYHDSSLPGMICSIVPSPFRVTLPVTMVIGWLPGAQNGMRFITPTMSE